MQTIFIYPSAPRAIHDCIEGFFGTTPFGGDDITNHFRVVDNPKAADLFWMGQYNDKVKERWLLHPNRFAHFWDYPDKHVIELEGDWRDQDFPLWLKPTRIITGNAHPSHFEQGWRIFVRPVMSPLLLRLVRDPPDFRPPVQHRMWFRGQRDSRGVREKLAQALQLSRVDHTFTFLENWSVYAPPDSEVAMTYCAMMKEYSTALCPRGEGMATCRFYEACAFGRTAVVVADNVLAGVPPDGWPTRIPDGLSVEGMAAFLSSIYEKPHYDLCQLSRSYFDGWLTPYFRDPTKMFLNWTEFS